MQTAADMTTESIHFTYPQNDGQSVSQSVRWPLRKNLMQCRAQILLEHNIVYTIVVEEPQHLEKRNIFRCNHKGSRYGTAVTTHGNSF